MNNLINSDLGLKGHVFFNKVDDGVYFGGDSNGFVLKGEGIYPLASKIVSLLDAGFSFAQIESKLPDRFQAFLTELCNQLYRHGMLKENLQESYVPESWMQFKPFADVFRYLQDKSAYFSDRFPKWLDAKVAVIGNGYALKSAVEGLAASGVGNLTVILQQGEVSVAEVRNLLNHYQAKLPGLTPTLLNQNDGESLDLGEFDQILFCSSTLDASNENLSCTETSSIVAGVLGNQALVSPLTSVSESGFLDMVRQLKETNEEHEVLVPRTVHSMLGSLAVHNVMRGFFDIDVEQIGNYVYKVSNHLEISRHPLLPLSTNVLAKKTLSFESEFEKPTDRELGEYENVRLNLHPYFDVFFGCLDESVSANVAQVPLFHNKLCLTLSSVNGQCSEDILSCGMDPATAGLRTISTALSIRSGVQLGVPAAKISTAFDKQAWEREALAKLIADQSEFKTYANSIFVNLRHIEHEEIQLLLQLLSSTNFDPESVKLYWNNECTSFVAVATAPTPEEILTIVDSSPMDAVLKCLNSAYLKCHFDERFACSAFHQSLTLNEPQSRDPDGSIWEQLTSQTPAQIPPLDMVCSDNNLTQNRVYSGYAKLKSECVEEKLV